MSHHLRRILFILFFLAFLVGAPLIVLYTAGYRLNPTTFRIQRTGVIALSTYPKNAKISINGELIEHKTPYVIQRLSPGSYTIRMERTGYHAWEERVDVNSGATTYVNATLFADAVPALISPVTADAVVGTRDGRYILLLVSEHADKQIISRFDTVTEITKTLAILPDVFTSMTASADDTTLLLSNETSRLGITIAEGTVIPEESLDSAKNPLPSYIFLDRGTSTELRNNETNTLITLLPPSTYTISYYDPEFALLRDLRDRTYLFSFQNETVTAIDLPTDRIAVNTTKDLLLGSNQNEIDSYSRMHGETTLLVRQQEPILAIGWHKNENAVLYATKNAIFAIGQEHDASHSVTALVESAVILDMWLDTTQTKILFFGTIDNTTGLWSLPMIQ